MKKICCGFGHREIYENISGALNDAIEQAIEKGCTEFLTGNMGDFDRKFASAVRKAKEKRPDIKLICVKPYFTRELQKSGEYHTIFDEVVIPDESAGAHPKSAITKRNRWMIDNSDIVIFFVFREHGGAYTAKQYAERQGKEIINIEIGMNNFIEAVNISCERWVDSLIVTDLPEPSEEHKRFIKENFGIDN